MRSSITVAALAATGLLLVGGGTALALGADEPTVAVAPTSATAEAQPGNAPQPAVDRAAAERIALERAGGGRVTEVEFDRADDDRDDAAELDDRDDRDHWEVEVRNGAADHDVDVDAATGEILDYEIDNDDRDDNDDQDDRDDD
ncbi:PepSY domain-containing protein [Pseudonocardia parietis]|uniref:Membrane protein YkoI n=1 Tax=Pseudonocardia parietis TaxID=570936 RepID=A0ABS4VNR1_9PSEU|nr:PepSY domain-containing protein [Pseudonocardia parietis]MBP2365554.1 putative membrane protein YkoI [Pseudonocardia parietis]